MVADAQSRQLISDILKLASPGAASAKAAGMKVTAIAGYPVFLCWAMWVGAEANANGVNKAILCLPYLQNPNVALTKFSGNIALRANVTTVFKCCIYTFSYSFKLFKSLSHPCF